MSIEKKPDAPRITPYPLRLPFDLRQQLAASAARNQRSLNGEIVFILQNKVQGDQQ